MMHVKTWLFLIIIWMDQDLDAHLLWLGFIYWTWSLANYSSKKKKDHELIKKYVIMKLALDLPILTTEQYPKKGIYISSPASLVVHSSTEEWVHTLTLSLSLNKTLLVFTFQTFKEPRFQWKARQSLLLSWVLCVVFSSSMLYKSHI